MRELFTVTAAALLAFAIGYASHRTDLEMRDVAPRFNAEISAPAGGLFGGGTAAERATD